MLKMNKEYAITKSIELAGIICSNPNYAAQPSEKSANDLADFISTLQSRFMCEDE
ncbi:MAG: hypothetical protein ACLSAP_04800 [Oscillospiraceae bacterium]